jgi:hypothetical protein
MRRIASARVWRQVRATESQMAASCMPRVRSSEMVRTGKSAEQIIRGTDRMERKRPSIVAAAKLAGII